MPCGASPQVKPLISKAQHVLMLCRGRAVVLEMIGDLPEADAKPPEDMLFVCKLNQVRNAGVLRRTPPLPSGLRTCWAKQDYDRLCPDDATGGRHADLLSILLW